MNGCGEHKWLFRWLYGLTVLVATVLISIWYQNIFLFPQLKIEVTGQITAMKSDIASLQDDVTKLTAIHPMGERK